MLRRVTSSRVRANSAQSPAGSSAIRRAVVETLEGRCLMHAGHEHFSANVDFQLLTSPVFAGYVADTGLKYGDRGNGFTYGWNKLHTDTARDRNSSRSPDERYDAFITMKNATWNIAVPNGTYDVRVVATRSRG
jgi:hypothetical protein